MNYMFLFLYSIYFIIVYYIINVNKLFYINYLNQNNSYLFEELCFIC